MYGGGGHTFKNISGALMKRALFVVAAALLVLPLFHAFAQEATQEADLDAIKDYLLEKTGELQESTAALYVLAQQYYDLADAAAFDYEALAADPDAALLLLDARELWAAASPQYEQMEGVVAGVPSLAEFDVILDAGASGAEAPEAGVAFNLTLPDGRVLERPGNLFGVTEATLWGTREDYSSGVWVDLDENGEQDFAELLPDANVLLAGIEALNRYTNDLAAAAEAWEPTETDAFTALVVMVPTMSEYFGSWKESRFVAGDEATRTDFVAISRLSDIQDILGGLQVVYEGVAPRVEAAGGEYATQIRAGLDSLRDYVADLYTQEQDGRVFTAEEADFFGSEAQDRAQEITGQISQAAALLGIELEE
jgi:hypothetical protein